MGFGMTGEAYHQAAHSTTMRAWMTLTVIGSDGFPGDPFGLSPGVQGVFQKVDSLIYCSMPRIPV